jgi:hypothetical protein
MQPRTAEIWAIVIEMSPKGVDDGSPSNTRARLEGPTPPPPRNESTTALPLNPCACNPIWRQCSVFDGAFQARK